MKLDSKTDVLECQNREHVDAASKTFGKDQTFTPLLQLIADVCDTAGKGSDCYMVIGTNRAKDALLITITQDRAKGYLSALDLAGLSEAAKSVL